VCGLVGERKYRDSVTDKHFSWTDLAGSAVQQLKRRKVVHFAPLAEVESIYQISVRGFLLIFLRSKPMPIRATPTEQPWKHCQEHQR